MSPERETERQRQRDRKAETEAEAEAETETETETETERCTLDPSAGVRWISTQTLARCPSWLSGKETYSGA